MSLGIVVLGSLPAHADETADLLQALQSAVEKEAGANTPTSGDSRGTMGNPNAASAAMFLSRLRSTLDNQQDSSSAEEMLNELPGVTRSAAVGAAAEKLRVALAADRKARNEAFSTKMDAALTKATGEVRAAKHAADLDRTLSELSEALPMQAQRPSEEIRRSLEKLRSLQRFATQWQDYLVNQEAGNAQDALNSLRNLQNDNQLYPIPRSQILALIQQLSAKIGENGSASTGVAEPLVRAIVEKTKTLEDIPAALDALRALRRQPGPSFSGFGNPIDRAREILVSLQEVYQEYRAGLPAQIELHPDMPSQQEAITTAMLPLRMQLLQLTVPRLLKVDERLPFQPGETLQKYLDRVLADAMQRLDVGQIGRVRDLQIKLGGRNASVLNGNYLQALLAAQNQEEAEQYALAVVSYQTALREGGELLPAKAVGERLAAIQATHPKEYEEGMQLFLGGTVHRAPQSTADPAADGKIVIPGAAASPKPSPTAGR